LKLALKKAREHSNRETEAEGDAGRRRGGQKKRLQKRRWAEVEEEADVA